MSGPHNPVNWSRGLRRDLQPWFDALYRLAVKLEPTARVTSAYRSRAEQTRLYRRYLAGVSKFPVAPPGRSKHEQGRAVDIVASRAVLRRLGRAWERSGGVWGGRFDDEIHFER